jgi:hypothetical protein
MSLQIASVVIFFTIVLPVVFAWHAFVGRYLLASLFAAINITVLLLLLLVLSGQAGHYLGVILLSGFGIALLAALLIGLPFLLARRKGKKRTAVS